MRDVPGDLPRATVRPIKWAHSSLVLRTATDDDKPFLERLFVAVRETEPGICDLPSAMRTPFLVSQYLAQDRHYASYAHKDFAIVEHDGRPVGRLYLSQTMNEIRVVDISLLPEVSGSGLGSTLLAGVQRRARALGKGVSLSVAMNNRAQRLYRRLGFVETAQATPYLHMAWQPDSPAGDLE